MILAVTLEDKADRSSERDPLKPPQAIIATTTVNTVPLPGARLFARRVASV
jgi:hypothetical protein